MLLLAKWKTTLAAVAVLVAVGGGAGVGVVPSLRAADAPAAKSAAKTTPAAGLADDEFLRRSCVALRGTPPTAWELKSFTADADAGKRKKVLGWLADGEPIAPPPPKPPADVLVPNARIEAETGDVLRLVLGSLGAADPKPAGPDVLNFVTGKPPAADTKSAGPGLVFTIELEGGDANFLTRVVTDLRGTPPTRIELEYFKADKDPKKREKVVDLLLADPAVRKKWVGNADGPVEFSFGTMVVVPEPPGQPTKVVRPLPPAVGMRFEIDTAPPKFAGLVGQLVDGKRSDDQILDAVSAAVLGRLPTDSERKLILAQVAKSADKKAAWTTVAATLAGTDDAKRKK